MILISVNCINMIIDQGIAVTDNIPEDPERISVVAVESIIGAKPHKAVMIPENAGDRIIGKAIFYSQTAGGVGIPGLSSRQKNDQQQYKQAGSKHRYKQLEAL